MTSNTKKSKKWIVEWKSTSHYGGFYRVVCNGKEISRDYNSNDALQQMANAHNKTL